MRRNPLFSLVVAAFCASIHGQTILVPADQPTIQAGINAASDGMTVLVSAGFYFEHDIDFGGKNIRVVGAIFDSTFVDAQGLGRAFLFQNGEGKQARLEGFTIQDGHAPDGADGTIGAVGAPDGLPGTAGLAGGHGGAILVDGASPRILRCVFRQNRAGDGGEGGNGGPGGSAAAGGMGGAGAEGGVGGSGGAIVILSGSPRIEACEFFDNFPGLGGSGGAGGPASIPTADGDGRPGGVGGAGGEGGSGSAVAVLGGSPFVTSCLLRDSDSAAGGGGGVGGAGGFASGAGPQVGGDGGAGGAGGLGGGGAGLRVFGGTPLIANLSVASNTTGAGGVGGPGGSAGAGVGGGADGSAGPSGAAGSTGAGGGLSDLGGVSTMVNLIVRDNIPDQVAGSPSITYSNILGGYPGTGNIDLHPGFAGPGDFSLTFGSPCIDSGDTTPILSQTLTSDPPTISTSAGGTINFFVQSGSVSLDLASKNRFDDEPFTLDTGAGTGRPVDMGALEFESDPLPAIMYWIVGSVSGTSPGFVISGLTIPLNPDLYFIITLTDANLGGFHDTLSALDFDGQGFASITLPAGIAPPGFTVHHAAGIFDFFVGPQGISNAVSTELIP